MRRIMNIISALRTTTTEEEFNAVFDSYKVTSKEANIVITLLTITVILDSIKRKFSFNK